MPGMFLVQFGNPKNRVKYGINTQDIAIDR